MGVTPDKDHHRNNIYDIFSKGTKQIPPLLKYPIYPKEGYKPQYEVSENYHY